MEANLAQLESCMYQYSRAIYRSIKDLIDPYVDQPTRLEYRREVLCGVRGHDGAAGARSAVLRESGPDAVPGHPPLLPDHRAGSGGLGGEAGSRCGGRVRRGADRGRRVRRRRRPLPARRRARARPCQRTPLPGARLLPVASAPRALEDRRPSGGAARNPLGWTRDLRRLHACERRLAAACRTTPTS